MLWLYGSGIIPSVWQGHEGMSAMLPQKVFQEEICEQQLPVQKVHCQRPEEISGKGLGLVFHLVWSISRQHARYERMNKQRNTHTHGSFKMLRICHVWLFKMFHNVPSCVLTVRAPSSYTARTSCFHVCWKSLSFLQVLFGHFPHGSPELLCKQQSYVTH